MKLASYWWIYLPGRRNVRASEDDSLVRTDPSGAVIPPVLARSISNGQRNFRKGGVGYFEGFKCLSGAKLYRGLRDGTRTLMTCERRRSSLRSGGLAHDISAGFLIPALILGNLQEKKEEFGRGYIRRGFQRPIYFGTAASLHPIQLRFMNFRLKSSLHVLNNAPLPPDELMMRYNIW